MATKPPRRVPDQAAATPEEIAAAIEELTPADWGRLGKFANSRIRLLGPKAECEAGEDLLQLALTSLLEDIRRWNKAKVRFPDFLVGAMRSISSNWAKSYKPEHVAVLEADLRRENEEGRIFSPLDAVREQRPDAEQRMRDKQILEQVDALFKDDEQAQMVLMAWQDGCDPPAVRELWNLSQKEYNTVVRRIRRQVDAAGLMPNSGKGKTNVQ